MQPGDERERVDVQGRADLPLSTMVGWRRDGRRADTRDRNHRLISWARRRASSGGQPTTSSELRNALIFCDCSIDLIEWARTGQRAGWVEYVGTLEACQRRGLGRAILLAGLRWLRMEGAQTAILVTMASNIPARSVYDTLGFRVVERDLVYTREVAAR